MAAASFGRWLRLRRRGLGLTQQELGQQAGYAGETIRKVEADELRPSRQLAEGLAAALGVAAEDREAFIRFARDRSDGDNLALPTAPALPTPGAPATPALASPSFTLPTPPTALIGREAELADVKALLSRADARLVTLTGAGGVGKTRLALEVAAELSDDLTDGVGFVNLAPLREPGLIVATIAQVLDIREQPGQGLLASLIDTLHDRRILLVLDNFEQIVEAAPVVAELLAGAPDLKLLVTSRAALRLRGEQEYDVPPLTVPDTAQPSVATMMEAEAVRLFVARAQAARRDFVLTEKNAEAVAAICQRLDGLPLAIELAAARVKVFSPQALLARLGSRLAVLTGGPRDAPLRQRTLWATLTWSYGLLGEAERRLFRQLGVFVGGFTLDAAETVVGEQTGASDEGRMTSGDEASSPAPNHSVLATLDGVAALVDQSLVARMSGVGGEARFGMLETVREYAVERLAESGEADAMRRTHALYYLAEAEAAEDALHDLGPGRALSRLEAEMDNLRAALAWMRAAGETESFLRLTAALAPFWYWREHVGEGKRWVEDGLSLAATLDDPWLRARLLRVGGHAGLWPGDLSAARAALAESVALARGAGDDRLLAEVLGGLGARTRHLGDLSEARQLWQESLAMARKAGSRWLTMIALGGLGIVTRDEGATDQAAALLAEALSLARELRARRSEGSILNAYGEVARMAGDDELAEKLYSEAIALFQTQAGLGPLAANALHNLGHVTLRRGEDTRALGLFQTCLRVDIQGEETVRSGPTVAGIAGVWQARGQPQRAARLLGAAAMMAETGGFALEAADRADTERILAAVRSQVSAEEFVAAWGEGHAMSLEEAVAYALRGATETA